MDNLSIGYPGSLHNHTEYSNLRLRDAIVRPKELIDYAIELGHSVVAFTEHETISNATIKIIEVAPINNATFWRTDKPFFILSIDFCYHSKS